MQAQRLILVAAVVLALGFAWLRGAFVGLYAENRVSPSSQTAQVALQKATFAGGCFWSVEGGFDKLPGVISTTSGYTGGHVSHPSYEQVTRGGTGHAESVEVMFDSSVVSYEQLLDHYWHNIDPFVVHRQFCDVGEQYRPEIFVHSEAQRAVAESSRQRIQSRFTQPILVKITGVGAFYPAEGYHQDFQRTHPAQYGYYRWMCGREARLREIWGDS